MRDGANEAGRGMGASARHRRAVRGAFAGAAVAALLSVTGCTDRSPQALFVQFNQAVDRASSCIARAGTDIARPIGWMDIGVTNRYLLFPSVENGMPPSASITGSGPSDLHLENNTVQVTGATIYYDLPADIVADLAEEGVEVPQGQFVFTSGSIEPNSVGVAILEVIPPLVGEVLRRSKILSERYATTQILVRVTVEAVLKDGDTVNSNEFVYPLNVCNGCLVYFSVPDCTALPTEEITLPCFPGQDEGLDCRACYQLAVTKDEAALCLPPLKK